MNKIALVYDWVDKQGGVERLLLSLHAIFPEAPLYTSFYDKKSAPWAKNIVVKPSFMQILPTFLTTSRKLSLPFFPYAFESLNLSNYDTVISISSSFAKGVITKPHTNHISIVLTPPRYFWDMTDTYVPSSVIKTVIKPVLEGFKKWDRIAATRPDKLFSISNLVKGRVSKIYNRDSELLYPPFDISYWDKLASEKKKVTNLPVDYYLVVSRLEKYKKVDLVIDTFNGLPEIKLVIVGSGTEKENLRNMASKNSTFYDNLTDSQLATVYSNAKALIMMQEEDFGYTALEALFFDCPVITYSKSGATEIVENNKTGLFVERQSKGALTAALERFSQVTYNVSVGKKHLLDKFSAKRFEETLLKAITIY